MPLPSPAFPPNSGIFLKEVTVGKVKLDVCPVSGGIWFDNYELRHFDEPFENAEELLSLPRDPSVKIDENAKRHCPKDGYILLKRYFSFQQKVVVDECPMCGGIWLDHGELEAIRSAFPSEDERKKLTDSYVNELFSYELKQNPSFKPSEDKAAENPRDGSRFGRFFRLFRFGG